MTKRKKKKKDLVLEAEDEGEFNPIRSGSIKPNVEVKEVDESSKLPPRILFRRFCTLCCMFICCPLLPIYCCLECIHCHEIASLFALCFDFSDIGDWCCCVICYRKYIRQICPYD